MWGEGRLHGDLLSNRPKLGLGVTSALLDEIDVPLGDVEADNNLNAKYALSGRQRELLKRGKVPNKSNRNKQTLIKRDLVADRLHDLVTDISLMHSASILSDEKWDRGLVDRNGGTQQTSYVSRLEEMDPDDVGLASSVEDNDSSTGDDSIDANDSDDSNAGFTPEFQSRTQLWEAIIDCPARARYTHQDAIFHGTHAASREVQFGYEVGSILRFLRPDDHTATFESRRGMEDVPGGAVIWGFIIGMIGMGEDDLDKEEAQLEALIEAVQGLHELRRTDVEKLPTMDEIERAQYRSGVIEAVEASSISPHPIVLREIDYHISEGDEYVEAHARRTLEQVIDVTPLAEVEDLRTSIDADLETIRERSKPGVDTAREVLLAAWEYYRENSSENEADEAEEGSPEDVKNDGDDVEKLSTVEALLQRVHTSGAATPKRFKSENIASIVNVGGGTITEVLHCLSDVDEYEQWTTSPLVRKYGEDSIWGLTDYGALLCYITLEHEDETDWLYRYAIGPEELSLLERRLVGNALGETGLIQ